MAQWYTRFVIYICTKCFLRLLYLSLRSDRWPFGQGLSPVLREGLCMYVIQSPKRLFQQRFVVYKDGINDIINEFVEPANERTPRRYLCGPVAGLSCYSFVSHQFSTLGQYTPDISPLLRLFSQKKYRARSPIPFSIFLVIRTVW